MRSTKKDPQQHAVYAWENALSATSKPQFRLSEIRRIIHRCCRIYRVPAPQVSLVTKDRRNGKLLPSYSDSNTGRIVIRPRHREPWTAIHEAAHAITDHLFGIFTGVEAHGREFLGIYLALLLRLRIMPAAALLAQARVMGLKHCPLPWIQPGAVRARYRARVRAARRERRMLSLWVA